MLIKVLYKKICFTVEKLFFGGVFLGAGLFVLYKGIIDINLSIESKDWSVTEGVIISSQIKKSQFFGPQEGGRISYNVDILYKYIVNRTSYRGNRVRIGGFVGTGSSSDFKEIVGKYKKIKLLECITSLGRQNKIINQLQLVFFDC